jgi:hypothetical protein
VNPIEPIDSTRVGPVERVRATTRRERRDPERHEGDEPRDRRQDERPDDPPAGKLVDVRV